MKAQRLLSTETIRRLRKVKAAILAEPKLYDQSSICRLRKRGGGGYCKTPACILGWAAALFNRRSTEPVSVAGREALLLADTEGKRDAARRLFIWWPMEFVAALARAATPEEQALVGARRIDHFIKTDGLE